MRGGMQAGSETAAGGVALRKLLRRNACKHLQDMRVIELLQVTGFGQKPVASTPIAHRVCLMYTQAAQQQHWFDQVTLIVWGPSARLLAGDRDLQVKTQSMMKDGVRVQACVVCADSYGVSDRLRKMGLEVKGMGAPLSQMLKDGWKVLTF